MYSVALPAPAQPPHMMPQSQNGPGGMASQAHQQQQQAQQLPTTPVRQQHMQQQQQQQAHASPMTMAPAAQAMYLQAQQYAQHQQQQHQLSLQAQHLSPARPGPSQQQQQQQQNATGASSQAQQAQHAAQQAALAYANTARRRASSPAVVFPPSHHPAASGMNGVRVATTSINGNGPSVGGPPLMRSGNGVPVGGQFAAPPGAYMSAAAAQQQMAAMAAAGYPVRTGPPPPHMQQQYAQQPGAAYSMSHQQNVVAGPSSGPGTSGAQQQPPNSHAWSGVAPPPGFYFEPPDFDDGEMMSGMAYDPYQVKHRKRTTPEQLGVLERAFDENSKPSAVARKMIADQIGMTPRSVQVWFQNRRQKRKMAEKKRLEEEAEGGNGNGSAAGSSESPQEGPRAQSAGDNPQQQQQQQQQHSSGPQHPSTAWTSIAPPVSPQRQPSFHRPLPQQQMPPQMVYAGVPMDFAHMPRQPASLPVAYPVGVPVMSQARRGSLPYPTPGAPPPGALANAVTAGMRVVSGPGGATRTHVPLRLAMTMNNGGRRASLPGTGRIVPLAGGVKPTRELSPIQDEQRASEDQSATTAATAERSVKTDPIAPTQLPGGSDFVMPKGLAQDAKSIDVGALPNPGFTFGSGGGGSNGGAAFNPFDGYTFGGGGRPDSVISPGEPSSTSSSNPYPFRGRIGSIASIFTQTTDAGTDGGTLSDTDRFQQGAPFDMSQYTFMPIEGGNVSAGGLQVPVGFMPDERRASAPAELLQQLSGLEVDHLNAGAPVQKRRSPLNTSFVAEASPADSSANTGRSSALHSSSLASFDMRTGHAQDLSRSSQSSLKPESPADLDPAQLTFDPTQYVLDGNDPMALLDHFNENADHYLDPASMQLWNAVEGFEEKPAV